MTGILFLLDFSSKTAGDMSFSFSASSVKFQSKKINEKYKVNVVHKNFTFRTERSHT